MATLVCPIHKTKELTPLGSCVSCRKRVQGIPRPESALATPAEPSTIMPLKRGRPAKFGVAMTPAERKAAERVRHRAEQDQKYKKKLVGELMETYDRQQMPIVDDDLNPKAVEERRRVAGEHKRQYESDLMKLSIPELRSALETQNQTPDSHGRLSVELGPGMFTSSEFETVHAKAMLTGGFTVGDDPANAGLDDVDPLLAGTFQVRPEGFSSDEYETEDNYTRDFYRRPRRGSKQPYKPTLEEKWLQTAMDSLVKRAETRVDDEGKEIGLKCPFCDHTSLVNLGLENHLYEEYVAGQKEERTTSAYDHLLGIELEIAAVKKAGRKKPKKPPKE